MFDTKEKIKNLETATVRQKYFSTYKTKLSYCLKCLKLQKVNVRCVIKR